MNFIFKEPPKVIQEGSFVSELKTPEKTVKASSVHWQLESLKTPEKTVKASQGETNVELNQTWFIKCSNTERSGGLKRARHELYRDMEPCCIMFHKNIWGIMEALIAAKDFTTRDQAKNQAVSTEVMKSKVSNFLCADSFLSNLDSHWSELWSCPVNPSGPEGIRDSILGTTGSDQAATENSSTRDSGGMWFTCNL